MHAPMAGRNLNGAGRQGMTRGDLLKLVPEGDGAASAGHLGDLLRVLPAYSAGGRVAVHAVYPSRRHMEQKVRVFVDYLAELYGATPYWDEGLEL